MPVEAAASLPAPAPPLPADPAPPPRTMAGKLIYLESIRGIAAVAVVFSHLIFAFFPILEGPYHDLVAPGVSRLAFLIGGTPLSVWFGGGFAVRLFFVLSGFVLSLAYFQTGNPAIIASAATRRYFRLMIPALASVLLGWLIFATVGYANQHAADFMHQPADSWLHNRFTTYLGFLAAIKQGAFAVFFYNFDDKTSLNVALWTMSVELQGSFLVFGVLAMFAAFPRRVVIYLALAFVIFKTQTFPFFMDFLVGLILADVYVRRQREGRPPHASVWLCLPLLVAGLIIGGLRPEFVEQVTHHAPPLWPYWYTVGALLIVGSVAWSPALQRPLEWGPLALLGKLSFSIYLVHMCLVCSLACSLYLHGRTAGLGHRAAALLASGACLVAVFVLSYLMYRLVDQPAIQTGRRVEAWLRQQVARPSARS